LCQTGNVSCQHCGASLVHCGVMTLLRDPGGITLGHAFQRHRSFPFAIKHNDRFSHVYIIGKTGTGKSTLIENMIRQDIALGHGCALIDPHGDLVQRVKRTAERLRPDDTVYLNVPDPAQPFGYNPLRHVHPRFIPLAASGLLEVMKMIWHDAWGVRMEHILRNAIYALLEQKDASLADILRLFSDKAYRTDIAQSLTNEAVRIFWETEFGRYSYAYRADGVASIQNKIGAFLANPVMKRILTEPAQDIHLRKIMDEGRVLIVNLAKGEVGDDSAALLGGLLVSTIGLAAMSRANQPPEHRRPFFVYIDEFQSFTTLSLANMMSELRKYGVGMSIAHQYLHQLEPDIRHAVLGNAGTVLVFRVGAEDACYLARELDGVFSPDDLTALSNRQCAIRLMVDGMPMKPFTATTMSLDAHI
jgi:type IV secretory pathway TraG/TraD family ATPase VirD4